MLEAGAPKPEMSVTPLVLFQQRNPENNLYLPQKNDNDPIVSHRHCFKFLLPASLKKIMDWSKEVEHVTDQALHCVSLSCSSLYILFQPALCWFWLHGLIGRIPQTERGYRKQDKSAPSASVTKMSKDMQPGLDCHGPLYTMLSSRVGRSD